VPVLPVDLAALDLGRDHRQANFSLAPGPIRLLEGRDKAGGVERAETLPQAPETALYEHVFESSRWL
jgi:hypothetical protein